MYVAFENIADSSRIWVFQSFRTLTSVEIHAIEAQLMAFCQDWTSHNNMLESSFTIVKDKFIIIAINEAVSEASGCSIDKSVSMVKHLEQTLDLVLLDKALVSFIHQDTVKTLRLSEVKLEVNQGILRPDTLVFNTLVATKSEYKNNFEIPASQTWLKKYFLQSPI